VFGPFPVGSVVCLPTSSLGSMSGCTGIEMETSKREKKSSSSCLWQTEPSPTRQDWSITHYNTEQWCELYDSEGVCMSSK